MPLDDLAELALRVMGQERVNQAQTMPDAIDVAVGLTDRTAGRSGAGVLVTGSVVSAGDARRLLKGTS
jgi:dihydrofolate synthase/folylpolyglutamate synthase